MKTGNFKIIWIRYVECLLFLFFKVVIFKGLLTIYAHLKMSSGLVWNIHALYVVDVCALNCMLVFGLGFCWEIYYQRLHLVIKYYTARYSVISRVFCHCIKRMSSYVFSHIHLSLESFILLLILSYCNITR